MNQTETRTPIYTQIQGSRPTDRPFVFHIYVQSLILSDYLIFLINFKIFFLRFQVLLQNQRTKYTFQICLITGQKFGIFFFGCLRKFTYTFWFQGQPDDSMSLRFSHLFYFIWCLKYLRLPVPLNFQQETNIETKRTAVIKLFLIFYIFRPLSSICSPPADRQYCHRQFCDRCVFFCYIKLTIFLFFFFRPPCIS